MAAIESFLGMLENVRQIRPDRWVARCPSHADKNPSLSIRVTSDGHILLHDFAGCVTVDILAAIGIEFSDLYPEGAITSSGKGKKPNHWHAAREALKTLHFEVLFVLVCAENMAKGILPTNQDRERLIEAVAKIRQASEYCV